jgi:hypothetical protein
MPYAKTEIITMKDEKIKTHLKKIGWEGVDWILSSFG